MRAGHGSQPSRSSAPRSGLVTGRGSEVEPGIRKSQNPSPRWGRQAVVQVWTEFRKPSTPFWKRFLPSSPRSCDQRVALLLSGGDRAGSRAPQRHQPAAPFLQLGFTVPGPGVRRDGRALRRLRDPAGRTGRMSQRPRRHFQLRFVPAWNARPSAENAAAARKRCRLRNEAARGCFPLTKCVCFVENHFSDHKNNHRSLNPGSSQWPKTPSA